MGAYVNGDAVNNALLNSLGPFDAIVMAGVTQSGRVYPTVADALTAGHKAIGVQDGAYAAGFTVSTSGCRIVGIDRPNGGLTLNGGPRFAGEIVIDASYTTIENIGVGATGTNGIRATSNASHVAIVRCHVGSPTGHGIWIAGGTNVLVDNCVLVGGAAADCGVYVRPASASQTWDGIVVRGCWIYDWLGAGVALVNAGSDTTVIRDTLITGNSIRNAGKGWTAGVYVESNFLARVTDNSVYACGAVGVNDASGIRINTPSTSPRAFSLASGNRSYQNRGYGISVGAVCDDVVVVGNTVLGNGVGQYQNCGSCPGYASGNTNLI